MKSIEEIKKQNEEHTEKILEKNLRNFSCPKCGGMFDCIWKITEKEVWVNYRCDDDCVNSFESSDKGIEPDGINIEIKKVLEFKEKKEVLKNNLTLI